MQTNCSLVISLQKIKITLIYVLNNGQRGIETETGAGAGAKENTGWLRLGNTDLILQ